MKTLNIIVVLQLPGIQPAGVGWDVAAVVGVPDGAARVAGQAVAVQRGGRPGRAGKPLARQTSRRLVSSYIYSGKPFALLNHWGSLLSSVLLRNQRPKIIFLINR